MQTVNAISIAYLFYKIQIVDALRATSAAPTYFKRQKIRKKDYSDGGLGANCPAAKGLQLAQYYWNQQIMDNLTTRPFANQIFEQSLPPMKRAEVVLSLGTGLAPSTKAKEYESEFF